MKQLYRIELKKATIAPYTLNVQIRDGRKKEGSVGFMIAGDDIDKLISWAEWKITNELCDFNEETVDMTEYKEVPLQT